MWPQPTNPMGHLGASALVAALPIITLFYVLAIRRWKGYQAGLVTLLVALGTAVFAYGMPSKLALLSALYGAMTGLFPIGWIVLTVVFLYNLSVKTGHFTVIKDVIASVTEDRRLQALLIGFCFGAFLEGAAGFGAPVAITAGMLVGLGFNPLYAAGLCLISNTAPVAFGGIGIAIITAGKVSNLDPMLISRMVAHQLPLLAFLVPFWLVTLMSGWRGVKEVWPAVLVTAFSYSVTMYLVATFLGPFLPDILSAIVSIIALVLFLHVWKPKNIWRFPGEEARKHQRHSYSWRQIAQAWTPFVLLTILVGDWGIKGIKEILEKETVKLTFAGLDKAISASGKPLSVVYSFGWLSAAGTAILIAGILTIIILRIRPRMAVSVFGETLKELKFPLLTIASVLGFAYVANFSGITATLGKAMTVTGRFFPLVAPFLGWLGVFVTGSDTSSNALFCGMQRLTAEQIGVSPVLTVASNTTGGVAAKMISPQSIAVASASVKLVGQESQLFRFTVKHSLAFVAIIGVVAYLQAYYLKGMVPELTSKAAAASGAVGSLTVSEGGVQGGVWLAFGLSLAVVLVLAAFGYKGKPISKTLSSPA